MNVRQISIGGFTVGIIGLDDIFDEVKTAGESDDEKLKDLIFEKVKARNYIAPGQEDAYREDLYDEYMVYTGRQSSRTKRSGLLELRVYGPGCPRCGRLDRAVMEVISAQGLNVDYQYVKDPAEMKRRGIMGSPALVINGKLAAVGRAPNRKELEKLLEQAQEQKS